jgi:sterol desaturase/sphingolipid hydroxylase (fatty acid hydroxylase superfamily)
VSAGLWAGAGLVAGTTALVATFLQASLHRLLGHGRVLPWFRRVHLGEHHSHYRPGRLAAPDRVDVERSLTPYYAAPLALVGLIAWLALPRPLFWVHAASMAAAFAAQVYVHDQFHIRRAWLNRYASFRTLRRYHNLHHRHADRNFSVLLPAWDVLFGTRVRRGRPGRAG